MPKGRRRSAQLGAGEYQQPGPNVVARLRFLQLIHRLAPEAKRWLKLDNDGGVWARRFGLERCAWFVEVGDATILMWRTNPGTQRHLIWGADGLAGRRVPERPSIPPWDDEEETEPEFDARIEAYKVAAKAIAASRGLIPTPELRNPLHLEWLVRRVIQKWSVPKIATTYATATTTPNPSTINRGINEAAAIVGLPVVATR